MLLGQGVDLLQVGLGLPQDVVGLVQLLADGTLHVFLPLVGEGQFLERLLQGFLGGGKMHLKVLTLLSKLLVLHRQGTVTCSKKW